ncbi:hypothetical protein ACROYT_G003891 [Oculina patagonica]
MASSNDFGHEIAAFVPTLCVLLGIMFPSCCGCTGDDCRIIMFKEPMENKAMTGHVIRKGGKYKCELNSASDENKLSILETREAFTFLAIENPCNSNPCLNGGTCQAGFTSKGFRCACRPGFAGANCSVLIKFCSDLKKHVPTAESGVYVIDPDGEGGLPPIYDVTCDMTDKDGVGVTVVSHDSEDRTLVQGKEYEDPGSYSRDIHYKGANLSQLASLANVSLHCEQFIKYECKGSLMFKSNKSHAWWVSRDSVNMTYWGGAEPGSGKCACGMNNTCADTSQPCNCDANDPTSVA